MQNFEYTMEQLSDTLSICVTKDHRFGTDAFLLSDFAAPRRRDLACDLGTGCGIIPLLWYRQREEGPRQAYGVDVQPLAIEQLRLSVSQADLKKQVIPVQADLTDLNRLKSLLPFGSFDLVTCNPPYKKAEHGILSESKSDIIARHETMCSIDDVCAAAAKLLQFGGRLCICQRPERLLDVMEAMRRCKIEPKRVRFVQKRGDTAPWLFLVEGRKGGNRFLKVEPPLIIQDSCGGFSEELRRIYRQPSESEPKLS